MEKATGIQCKYYPECISNITKSKDDIKSVKRIVDGLTQLHLQDDKNGKVNTKLFFWMIGLIITIVLALQSYNASQVSNLTEKVISLKADVAGMTATLAIIKDMAHPKDTK